MSSPKNVILIMTDQQHYRTLGCTGASEARTPNIDRLAQRGVVFRNHIVANPVCSPSRGCIMTGKHTTEHGLWFNGCTLPTSHQTVPTAFNEAGYQTAVFGKMHLVPIIRRTQPHPPYGFQTAEVAEGDQQLIDDAYFRWLRTTNPDLFVQYLAEMYEGGHADGYKSKLPEKYHLSRWVTDRSIDWLKNRRTTKQPFFMKVSYFDPHHAFNPVEPYASMYDDIDVPEPVFEDGAIDSKPQHYRNYLKSCQNMTRDSKRMTAIIKSYHAMVAHIDACVGDLMKTLEDQGLAQDTVVMFTSDHGELLGNHGLLWKGPYMLDDLLRVPMVVGIPGGPGKGQVTDELTSAVDIFATLGSVAGLADFPRHSGRRFIDSDLNLFPDQPHEYVLTEWEHPKASSSDSLRCLRTKTHKLVHYNHSDEGELYDLQNDPHEFRNLYEESAHKALCHQLTDQLAGHYLSRRPPVPYEGGW